MCARTQQGDGLLRPTVIVLLGDACEDGVVSAVVRCAHATAQHWVDAPDVAVFSTSTVAKACHIECDTTYTVGQLCSVVSEVEVTTFLYEGLQRVLLSSGVRQLVSTQADTYAVNNHPYHRNYLNVKTSNVADMDKLALVACYEGVLEVFTSSLLVIIG